MSQVEKIKVKSGFIGTRYADQVAFSDPSEIHGPDGAFVYGDAECEVAVTDDVRNAIRQGRLVVVEQEDEDGEEVAAELVDAQVVTLDAKNPDAATADSGLMVSSAQNDANDPEPPAAAPTEDDDGPGKNKERERRTAAKSR